MILETSPDQHTLPTTMHPESPAEFTAFIKAERERIAPIGRQVNITVD